MKRIAVPIAVVVTLGFSAVPALAQVGGSAGEMPSDAKMTPQSQSGSPDSAASVRDQVGAPGGVTSSSGTTGNAQPSGTTLGGNQKDATGK